MTDGLGVASLPALCPAAVPGVGWGGVGGAPPVKGEDLSRHFLFVCVIGYFNVGHAKGSKASPLVVRGVRMAPFHVCWFVVHDSCQWRP